MSRTRRAVYLRGAAKVGNARGRSSAGAFARIWPRRLQFNHRQDSGLPRFGHFRTYRFAEDYVASPEASLKRRSERRPKTLSRSESNAPCITPVREMLDGVADLPQQTDYVFVLTVQGEKCQSAPSAFGALQVAKPE